MELRRDFEFMGTNSMPVNDENWFPRGVFLAVLIVDVGTFVEQFPYLTRAHLRLLCNHHGLSVIAHDRRAALRDRLCLHRVCSCSDRAYLFRLLVTSRDVHRAPRTHAVPRVPNHNPVNVSNRSRPVERNEASWDDKKQIIQDWQEVIQERTRPLSVCAVCAWSVSSFELVDVDPCRIDLSLLVNDCLPEYVMPHSYDRALYENAILCSEGMHTPFSLGLLRICSRCRSALFANTPKQPKFALANFLYYGFERLPIQVRNAFAESSAFDRMLVSRARGTVVTHHYVRQSARGGYVPEECSQRFNRGNVAIFPQDATHLRDVLPPSGEDIRDTICIVFSGGTVLPTIDSLKRFRPVLVRKSRVQTMIEFLMQNNEWYLAEGVTFSQANLLRLFGEDATNQNEGVLRDMQIFHLKEDGTSDVDEWAGIRDDFLMDNVSYTENDHSPRSREQMKLRALAHALDHKQFVRSNSGNSYLPDSSPGFMSFLFPHLDPWGIGGFHHPGRRREQTISFEAQVTCLLRQYNSPFLRDSTFPFVCWNIMRKRSVSVFNTFGVRVTRHQQLARQLETLAPHISAIANKWERDPNLRAQTDEEKLAMKLLSQINSLSKNLQGSAGYKLCRRNEVRSLIRRFSTPALFITLNPHDYSSAIFARLMEIGDAEWEQKNAYERARLVVSRPDIAAKAFDIQIRTFVETVLCFGTNRQGLFGQCEAYYGMVEAQGRGTLHCHMLIWIKGNLSPQELRDKMGSDELFKHEIFRWLEDIIHCELPDSTSESIPAIDVIRPERSEEEIDPRVERQPRITEMDEETFHAEFMRRVRRLAIECNWHVHNETCFKYLKQGEPRTDATCRMRINGETRKNTEVDDETHSILLRRFHPWINNYNEVVLFILQSNMDIKFIGSGPAAKALVYYISDYITKTDLRVHTGVRSLQTAIQTHAEKFANDSTTARVAKDRSLLTKCVNSLMARQEISHQQVMAYLLEGGDYYTSHTFRNVPFFDFRQSLSRLETCEGDSDSEDETESDVSDVENENENENVTTNSFVLTTNISETSISSEFLDYKYRPDLPRVEDMNVWDFFSCTAKHKVDVANDSNEERSNCDVDHSCENRLKILRFCSEEHPQYETHGIKIRTGVVVPVLLGQNIPNKSKDEEEFCKTMLLLFRPWRSLKELRNSEDSWKESFDRFHFSERAHELIRNMNVESECRDAKILHSEQSQTTLNVSNDNQIPHELETSEPEDLLALLANDLAACHPELHTTGDDDADVAENEDISDNFHFEDEDHIRECAIKFSYSAPQHSASAHEYNQLILVDEESCPQMKAHMKHMNVEKRLKRPSTCENDKDERPKKRVRTSEREPEVAVERLVDNLGSTYVEYKDLNETERKVIIEDVYAEFGFHQNEEQGRAFHVAAQHFVSDCNDQLLFLITGMGGTGKSHVIKAIVQLFKRCGCSENLLLSAPTGCAAIIIDGYTIHALTFLPGKLTTRTRSELENIWANIKYLILDEVSMVSAELLSKVSDRMSIAKGYQSASQDKPFGGVNVIFAGDLCQLRPVIGRALYAHNFVKRQSVTVKETKRGQQGLFGANIWNELTHVVILRVNIRAKEDPLFVNFLERFRIGNGTAFAQDGVSDYNMLKSRLMNRLVSEHLEQYEALCNAPVIFGQRRFRDQFNDVRAKQFANTHKQDYNIFLSTDKVEGNCLRGKERMDVCRLRCKESKELLGLLPLVLSMPVMITENISMRHKIVNGTKGTLREIIYRNSDEGKEAICAYIEVKNCDLGVRDDNSDLVPIFPQTTYFDHQLQNSRRKIRISRTQLPLIPAWAFTDYKVQGSTLDCVVIDLASARGLQNGYVMLSRAKALSRLGILRWFPPHRIFARLQEDLRDEIRRLENLEQQTMLSLSKNHTQ